MNGAAGESAAAVTRLIGLPTEGRERKVSTDHANLSIAVDERYLVKWFRDPVAHDAFEVVEHLAAAGFEHMPRFVGVVDDGGWVVAAVSELVPGATDGWQWYVGDVIAWLDGSLGLDDLTRTAACMGTITADLHVVLAGDTVTHGTLQSSRAWARERRRLAIDQTPGEAGVRLRARLGQIDEALCALDSSVPVPVPVPVQRIHGDLHAGQFLRAADRLLLTDFDGDPLEPGQRPVLSPVERDVAGLLQSIDHVGRIAARRREGTDVAPFVSTAIAAALDAYERARPLDHRLLFALRVAQELHEYAYAATRLPIWGYVPDAAMTALFPDEDDLR